MFRAAVSPVRRRFDSGRGLTTVDAAVASERPADPLHCLRPATIAESARLFAAALPGDVLYAVKCNAEPRVLRAVWAGGIRHFDCASLPEISLIRQMFRDSAIHFMHPVKSRPAIREAYGRYGVKTFVLDSSDELAKIIDETAVAAGQGALNLIVRLAVPSRGAAYDLSGKFGADAETAVRLLRAARPLALRLGLAFHVGSQNLRPAAYTEALIHAGAIVARAGVDIEVMDVGGGFPVSYADTEPPRLAAYMAAINAGLHRSGLAGKVRLWAEPGRALVAAGTSIVVQVQLRRGRDLYINDGVYGSLSDAGSPGFRFPARLIRPEGPRLAPRIEPFRLFGPTCDAADRMDGPFQLPADVSEGDWIEIGQIGAYGGALRTAFNGFDRARLVEVSDPPLLATPTPGYEFGTNSPRRASRPRPMHALARQS